MHFDLKKSNLVFSKTMEDLCAPHPVPQSLAGLHIDISDYPNLMMDIAETIGTDVNAEVASEMQYKCLYYSAYISEKLRDISKWALVTKCARDEMKGDLMNNINGKCPGAGLEKSESAKERVASLNPQLRIAVYEREMAKAIVEYFTRLYEGLMKAHYAFKATVERETQARKSQTNDNMLNDLPETI